MFSEERKTAQRRYQRFVEEVIKQASPWKSIQCQILLGDEGFIDKFKYLLAD